MPSCRNDVKNAKKRVRSARKARLIDSKRNRDLTGSKNQLQIGSIYGVRNLSSLAGYQMWLVQPVL